MNAVEKPENATVTFKIDQIHNNKVLHVNRYVTRVLFVSHQDV